MNWVFNYRSFKVPIGKEFISFLFKPKFRIVPNIGVLVCVFLFTKFRTNMILNKFSLFVNLLFYRGDSLFKTSMARVFSLVNLFIINFAFEFSFFWSQTINALLFSSIHLIHPALHTYLVVIEVRSPCEEWSDKFPLVS